MSRVTRTTVLPALLAAAVGWPLAEAALALARRPDAAAVWLDAPRLLPLAANSAALAAGAVAVAVPLGVAAAVAVERGGVGGAFILRGLIAVGVFVPLPVYASAWQAAFGTAGEWRPWREGLAAAVWVHAMAGLPWAAAVAAVVLRTTDRRLEDDARLAGGPRAVLRFVLLPRLVPAAAAAAACVAVTAWTAVTVTDVVLVRTFAEEVYTELIVGPAGVPAAAALAVPGWLFAAVVGVWLARKSGVGAAADVRPPTTLPLPRWVRITVTLALWAGVALVVGVPLAALLRTAGTLDAVRTVAAVHGGTLLDSLLWAAATGLLAAGLAWAACVRAAGSRRWAAGVFALAAVAWVTPGPVLGFGLKAAISRLLAAEDFALAAVGIDPAFPPLRSLLYDQPSPAPAVWAAVVRFFPVAVAVMWPAFRRVPRELRDLADLDGGPEWRRRLVDWPLTRGAFARAAAAAAVLALGEVDAGKLVQPPGRQSFVQELFNAMHYGPDATVAALSLLQIAATVAACGLLMSWKRN